MGLLKLLREMAFSKTMFRAEYMVITPSGNKSRFQRASSLEHMQGARSETAVLAYLQRLHPGCTIQIQSLDFE